MSKNNKLPFDINIDGFKYKRRGCDERGWQTHEDIYYRCSECGTLMHSLEKDYNCSCGAMYLDYDYGRFGSRNGDDEVLVYEKLNLSKFQMFTNKFVKRKKYNGLPELTIEMNSSITEDMLVVENLGMSLYDGSIAPLIDIHSIAPIQRSYTFSTTEDNQDQIKIKLYRGKDLCIYSSYYLGEYQVVGIPELPATSASVLITFKIENNEISILAKDLINSKYLEICKKDN